MKILRMAWRNVWRNRRRSLVTIAAMTLALSVMVLYSAMVEGYMQGMERNLLALELGDVQIHHPDYQDDPSLYARVRGAAAIVDALSAIGYPAAPRLLGGGLAAARQASAGASLRGIDLTRDADVSDIGKHVMEGRWLDASDPAGVVIGRRLAHTLGVELGDELILLGQAYDGSMANDLYAVRGILHGISDGTDRAGVFLTAVAFREFFAFPDGAHQIIVRRPDALHDLDTVAARTGEVAQGMRVETWRQIVPILASMLDSARGLIVFVFLIVYIAIGILILNAMLMAVFERIREIGVLKALGVSPLQVLLLMASEAAIQTLIALCLGLAIAAPGLIYLRDVGIDMGAMGGMSTMGVAMDPIWRAVITPASFSQPIVTLLVIVGIAVLYPAIKAATIQPIEAIQHR